MGSQRFSGSGPGPSHRLLCSLAHWFTPFISSLLVEPGPWCARWVLRPELRPGRLTQHLWSLPREPGAVLDANTRKHKAHLPRGIMSQTHAKARERVGRRVSCCRGSEMVALEFRVGLGEEKSWG